jgi:hypothetical protein
MKHDHMLILLAAVLFLVSIAGTLTTLSVAKLQIRVHALEVRNK